MALTVSSIEADFLKDIKTIGASLVFLGLTHIAAMLRDLCAICCAQSAAASTTAIGQGI